MKTYSAKASEINKAWIVVDATDVVVGRLASFIANRLRGKHKPTYTPHMDCGDHVIVVNAEKVRFTGRKWSDKTYYRHTGYPGGIKEQKAWQIRDGKYPERILQKAVERMVPRGPLGRQQMSHLRVYAGEHHPHEAQQPVTVDFKSLNSKNTSR